MRSGLFVLLAAAAACAPAARETSVPGGSSPAPETRSETLPVIVTVVDSTARPTTRPVDIALVSYLDTPQKPLGCTHLAGFALVTSNPARMREAVMEKGAQMGATLLIVSHMHQIRSENNMSRTGVGVAVVRTQYGLEAYDCRS
jgi:hypothetical protein